MHLLSTLQLPDCLIDRAPVIAVEVGLPDAPAPEALRVFNKCCPHNYSSIQEVLRHPVPELNANTYLYTFGIYVCMTQETPNPMLTCYHCGLAKSSPCAKECIPE